MAPPTTGDIFSWIIRRQPPERTIQSVRPRSITARYLALFIWILMSSSSSHTRCGRIETSSSVSDFLKKPLTITQKKRSQMLKDAYLARDRSLAPLGMTKKCHSERIEESHSEQRVLKFHHRLAAGQDRRQAGAALGEHAVEEELRGADLGLLEAGLVFLIGKFVEGEFGGLCPHIGVGHQTEQAQIIVGSGTRFVRLAHADLGDVQGGLLQAAESLGQVLHHRAEIRVARFGGDEFRDRMEE